jgi:hypothetical protein
MVVAMAVIWLWYSCGDGCDALGDALGDAWGDARGDAWGELGRKILGYGFRGHRFRAILGMNKTDSGQYLG